MEGIIVGSDSNQERLLSKWWTCYSTHNSYPVLFVDFGMSQEALAWCHERGAVLPFSAPFPLKPLSPHLAARAMGRCQSELDHFRAIWFKKPLALLHTPFPFSCWLDLDCEVRGNLAPLFHSLHLGAEMALVKEPEYVQLKSREMGLIGQKETVYNGGVVAFIQNAPLLHAWAQTVLANNGEFFTDQEALSHAIDLHQGSLIELPSAYNWKDNLGPNPHALVLHYAGASKSRI